MKEIRYATKKAKAILKIGDRVSVTVCLNKKVTFTLTGWDGIWMESKTLNYYSPYHIYKINGKPFNPLKS